MSTGVLVSFPAAPSVPASILGTVHTTSSTFDTYNGRLRTESIGCNNLCTPTSGGAVNTASTAFLVLTVIASMLFEF